MLQTTYQVTLSDDDGDFAVTIATSDAQSMKKAVEIAKRTFDELVAQPANMAEQEGEDDPPVCAVHNVPMVRQQGKHGFFWSCHEKNADGSWCSYKPSR